MKTIIIGFSRSTVKFPIFSWLVQVYQGFTPYSHCYIKLITTPSLPSNTILHAAEGQVCQYSETAFLTRNKIIKEFLIDVPDNIYEKLKREYFHEKSGESYSILQNIGLVYARFFRTSNPFTNGWNCSEYAAEILKYIYPNKFAYLDGNKVTPKDIYIFLMGKENERELRQT